MAHQGSPHHGRQRANAAERIEERLEEKRRRINERIDNQKERINRKLDQKMAEFSGELSAKQEQIISAALELLAAHGLNELSLRDIAQKINIKAPALYWHFKNKSLLVDYMAETILNREFTQPSIRSEGEPWQEWLATYIGRLRKAMLAYPDGGRVVAGAHLFPARTLAQIFEDIALSLTSAGVNDEIAMHVGMTAVHFTFGFVIEEQSGMGDDQGPEDLREDFARSFPNFYGAITRYHEDEYSWDRAFAAGINLIIRGVQSK